MVSSEEKRNIIKNIIQGANQEIRSLEKQLYELLLRDTNGGKLYKYRSFDEKGFALKNLQDGTLHCSKPSAFNDPFDCKIGVTLQSLYETIYGDVMDMLRIILEKCIWVVRDEMKIDDCSVVERRVIEKLTSNETLMRVIMDKRDREETSEQFASFLHQNSYIITELMQLVLSDETFASSLGIFADMLPRMVDNITPDGLLLLSNENVTFADVAHINGVMDDADEIELARLLSQKLYPENNGTMKNMQRLIDDIVCKLTDQMNSLLLMGCLCTDYKNRLMWSHYADSHRGFCVEYDFSGTEESVLSKLPFPIFYDENRPLFPWKIFLENTPENVKAAYTQVMLGVLTKDKVWEYENEWRILIKATASSEFKMPRISCIYLGEAIRIDNREQVINIARDRNIPVKQMKVDRGTYALHAENVII
ncbi:MAG: DUF2971 domain-containing protein [Lachnospiraceae bacterium]|nr:DUF2971 domain-containing protein [Lachnospiraceae bacterium]